MDKNRDHRNRPYDQSRRGQRDEHHSERRQSREPQQDLSPESNESGGSRYGRHSSGVSRLGSEPRHSAERGNTEALSESRGSEPMVIEPQPSSSRGPAPTPGVRKPQQKRDPNEKRERRPRVDFVRTDPRANPHQAIPDSRRDLQLAANYFDLNIKNWSLFQYAVTFDPPIDSTRFRKGLLYAKMLEPRAKIFDGNVLRTRVALREDQLNFQVESQRGEKYTINLTFTKNEDFLDPAANQVLNLLVRYMLAKLSLVQVGRNYYDASEGIDIRSDRYRLSIWPGYLTTIRQHDRGLLMGVDFINKIMQQESCLQMIRHLQQSSRNWKEDFLRQVIGVQVLTRYNNKTYTITDVDYAQNPLSTFARKNDEVSYIDYYRMEPRNQEIRDLGQPLLLAKSRDREMRGGAAELVALIPELCYPTGLTEEMRQNVNLKRDISNRTRLNPNDRVNRLLSYSHRIRNTDDSIRVLRDWNFNIQDQIVTLQGKQIENLTIRFADNKETKRPQWMNAFANDGYYDGGALTNWCYLYPNDKEREANIFLNENLKASVRNIRYHIGEPRRFVFDRRNNTSLDQNLRAAMREDPQIILVLIEREDSIKYQMVKKLTCVDNAVPTQVVTLSRALRGGPQNLSVATKIALQMNTKIGFAPWHAKVPLTSLMVVGFDVSKEGPHTYGAMVAVLGLKENPGKYFSIAAKQNGERFNDQIDNWMMGALKAFKARNNDALPTKIIFYRDGVSDGQLQTLVDYEIKGLTDLLGEIYASQGLTPRFTYVVVNKSINTRIFAQTQRGYENPPCGTVVQDTITLPERYDFYLISQSVGQGTVCPTSYNVIEDGIKLSPERLQYLTYQLCHLYYNWNGTIRVPAVCQYAKKLAMLCSKHLHSSPNSGFRNFLYFL